LLAQIAADATTCILQAVEQIRAGNLSSLEAANAERKVRFLQAVSYVSRNSSYQAQAEMSRGTFLLVLAQLEEALGKDASASRKQATVALTRCTRNRSASAGLRARAEGNLAAVAGEAHPDLVDKHQRAAQELAEQAGDLETLRTVRRDRAVWAKQRGDWRAAYDRYRQNIEDTERVLWKEGSPFGACELVPVTRPDYAAIVETCLELAKEDPSYYERALEFVDHGKARSFLHSLANSGFSDKSIPPRLLERRKRILKQLSDLGNLKKMSPDIAELHESEMQMLLWSLGKTESQIGRLNSTFVLKLNCAPLSFGEMQALVPAGAAMLSYFWLPNRLLIFVLTDHGLAAPPAEVRLSHQELASVVGHLLVTIRIGRSETADRLEKHLGMPMPMFLPTDNLTFLYRTLIQPVREHIEGRNLLYIIAHGKLRDLPFHALRKEDGSSLLDDVAVAYAPSIAVLRQCIDNRRTDLHTCYAAGVSKEKGGPATATEEAGAVAEIFAATPARATRDAILRQAGQFDVLHLACHSDVGSAITSYQGLQLEDGVLYKHEIAKMDCHASLVVLSACDTAEGDLSPDQEMAGLVGAFMRAGAPSVIASLWPVADRAALPIMTAFYTALKKMCHNKAGALRQAQIEVKAQKEFSHPYFWAPFSLWGDT